MKDTFTLLTAASDDDGSQKCDTGVNNLTSIRPQNPTSSRHSARGKPHYTITMSFYQRSTNDPGTHQTTDQPSTHHTKSPLHTAGSGDSTHTPHTHTHTHTVSTHTHTHTTIHSNTMSFSQSTQYTSNNEPPQLQHSHDFHTPTHIITFLDELSVAGIPACIGFEHLEAHTLVVHCSPNLARWLSTCTVLGWSIFASNYIARLYCYCVYNSHHSQNCYLVTLHAAG